MNDSSGRAVEVAPGKRRRTKRRIAWCVHYQRVTTFEPLMDDFMAGNESFVEAAQKSLQWFEDWSNDAYLSASESPIPGDDDDLPQLQTARPNEMNPGNSAGKA